MKWHEIRTKKTLAKVLKYHPKLSKDWKSWPRRDVAKWPHPGPVIDPKTSDEVHFFPELYFRKYSYEQNLHSLVGEMQDFRFHKANDLGNPQLLCSHGEDVKGKRRQTTISEQTLEIRQKVQRNLKSQKLRSLFLVNHNCSVPCVDGDPKSKKWRIFPFNFGDFPATARMKAIIYISKTKSSSILGDTLFQALWNKSKPKIGVCETTMFTMSMSWISVTWNSSKHKTSSSSHNKLAATCGPMFFFEKGHVRWCTKSVSLSSCVNLGFWGGWHRVAILSIQICMCKLQLRPTWREMHSKEIST